MDSYKIAWKQSAVKELKKLPKEMIAKILATVEKLSSNPCPPKTTKLIGTQQSFRIRVGDYRIVYNVFSKTLIIEIVRVRHRRDVYQR
jgi:mRNA interferase RelE/StbE